MNKNKSHDFQVTVDGVPYFVEATPYELNDQIRYHVSINGGPLLSFAWNDELQLFKALNDDASTLPEGLILAITQNILELTRK